MKAPEILQKLNWFLKPISELILFLFTTRTGIILLLVLIIFSVYLILYNRIRERKLLNEAATDSNKLSMKDFLFILTDELGKIIAKIIANFTVLLVVLFLMLAIVGLSATFTSVDTFITNNQNIKQLSSTVKNLHQSYKVAKVEILDYNLRLDSTTLEVSFYDYAKNGFVPKKQKVKLAGHNIYFVNYVMNFEYSEIENGKNINIAIPYLIYSDKMTQKEGVKLLFKDENGVPFVFHRDSNDLYGIDLSTYNEKMQEIVSYMNDAKLAKKAGIRSMFDSSPHYVKALNKGQIFYIWVEQTGGLVIKEEDWSN